MLVNVIRYALSGGYVKRSSLVAKVSTKYRQNSVYVPASPQKSYPGLLARLLQEYAGNAAADGYTRRTESREKPLPYATSCGCPSPLWPVLYVTKEINVLMLPEKKMFKGAPPCRFQINPSNSMLIKSLNQASLRDLKQIVCCVCVFKAQQRRASVICHKRKASCKKKKIERSLVALQHNPRALPVLRVYRTTSAMYQRGR